MKTESQTKTQPIETTERTLTVKLPKKFDDYLQGLARVLNRTVESLLLEDLYAVLENFFQGGFATGWTDEILDGERGKDLDEQVSQVANAVLNQ